jgi:hypothetical protein
MNAVKKMPQSMVITESVFMMVLPSKSDVLVRNTTRFTVA